MLSQDSTPPRLECSVIEMCAQTYRVIVHAYSFYCYAIKTSITYPKSSLSSFLDASKGTFRTRILELFCFFEEAVLRCATMSLKRNIDGARDLTISGWLVHLPSICRLFTRSCFYSTELIQMKCRLFLILTTTLIYTFFSLKHMLL